jgi:hypothetical protein
MCNVEYNNYNLIHYIEGDRSQIRYHKLHKSLEHDGVFESLLQTTKTLPARRRRILSIILVVM